MRRRNGTGCPITGALQMIGDKWTLLIVRALARGPRRTTEILNGLHPISSRTLVQRLRDMEEDEFLERRDFGGNPPHVEYALTQRGRRLLPVLEVLRDLGNDLGCEDCATRFQLDGSYCEVCPRQISYEDRFESPARRDLDDSIVLL
ncbi:MAG: helix-turn-helix domain-containing protein [Pyrinomonadaceae bacterium]